MRIPSLRIIASLVAAVMSLTAMAGVDQLPVKRINGRLYHYYEVAPGETIYSLCYKLDVTRDEMMRNNPAASEGLRAGMMLYFPFEDEVATTTAAPAPAKSSEYTYEVQRGETIFGISRKFGISSDALISANPVLKNGLKAGQTIVIPGMASPASEPAAPATEEVAVTEVSANPPTVSSVEGYIVKKKETFYSIARAHGLSVAALEAANPGVTSLREGQVLNIPVSAVSAQPEEEVTEVTTVSTGIPTQYDTISVDSLPGTSIPMVELTPALKSTEVSVAILLPFMLNEETPSKSATRYTEFYKGFLLAADSLRDGDTPIHIAAYDTEGSVLKVREALTDSTFARHNLIIAPDNAVQLAVLAEYGRNNGVKVLNAFLVRDESHLSNPAVMQGNLPSPEMYSRVIDALLERLTYSTPVFLTMAGEKGDKADFVAELRKALSAKGQTFVDIEVDGRLNLSQLQLLPADGNFMFIPESSRQADLNKLMPALIQWRDQAITPTVRLFGYPEWTTFRGETEINMHNLNTLVFSRFYTDEDSWRTRAVDSNFRRWYGTKMENAVPRQGLMGFDTGMFVIPYLATGENNGYDGVQNGFFFSEPSPDAGVYNQALYFINFKPGSGIEKTRI